MSRYSKTPFGILYLIGDFPILLFQVEEEKELY